jgi:exopolysaccharide biosynthesis polyprenyl glycosylphosphotransferase
MRALLETVALAVLVAGVMALDAAEASTAWPHTLAALGPAAALAACCVLACYYASLYEHASGEAPGRLPRLVGAVAAAGVAAYVLAVVSPAFRLTPDPGMSAAVTLALLLGVHAAGEGVLASRALTQRVLLLGSGPLARALVEEIEARSDLPWVLFVPGNAFVTSGDSRRRRTASSAELQRLVERARPDRIVVALDQRRGLAARQLLESRAQGIPVEDGLDVYERLTGKVAIEAVTPSALLFGHGFRRAPLHRSAARVMSVAAAAAGLTLVSPILALVAVAVRLDSPGPILFRQARLGLHGRPFTLLKFRTMHPTSAPPSEWARDNQYRVTRFGRWLRRFRLDELPQLVNVLRGDMNLVGPRPHPACNAPLFAARIPYYSLRTVVRPGITGWAQVRYGYANGLEEETEKMRYDLYYVKHQSIWLDLRIVLDTARAVAGGRAAHAPRVIGAAGRPVGSAVEPPRDVPAPGHHAAAVSGRREAA